MPRADEMWIAIASSPAAAARRAKALARRSEVEKLFAGIGIVNNGSHRDLQNGIDAGTPVTLGAFAVPAALGAEFAIVAIAKKRVVIRIRFQVDVAAVAAISAGRAPARDVFFPAESHAAVAAVATLHFNFRFVCKHWISGATLEKHTPLLRGNTKRHHAL